MSNDNNESRQKLIRLFFFAAFGFLLYQIFLVSRPFLPAIFGATMLAMAFHPAYAALKKRIANPNIAALLMTFLVFLIVVVPVSITAGFLVREAGRLMPVMQEYMGDLRAGDFVSLRERLPDGIRVAYEKVVAVTGRIGIDPKPLVIRNIHDISEAIVSFGGVLAKNMFFILFSSIMLLLTLFFAFRDGEALVKWAVSLIPLRPEHKEAIAKRAFETFRAVAVGVSVTAMAQGFVAMIGYWIGGVRLPILLGLLTTVTSFLGFSAIVTIPAALSVMSESTARGIFLLVWGMGLVGSMDNILRPLLIGSKARMPFILILFSIIGGIKAYGVLGFFLGPMLVASVLTFIKIYREEYHPG